MYLPPHRLRLPGLLALLLLVVPAARPEGVDACALGSGCSGVALDATYLGDVGINLRGGEQTGDGWSHLGRAGLLWHTQVAGTAWLTTRLSSMYMGGRGIGAMSGDLQGLNNIEASRGLRLYEFWSELQFGRGVSVRSGFLDLNAEFDVPETAALFVSPPHGIGTEFAMSGRNGPAIWPVSGLGVRLAGDRGNLAWRLAAFEGEPGKPDAAPFARVDVTRDEGALLVGELSWRPRGTNKIQFGTWQYTAQFELLDPAASGRRERGNRGAYALFDLPAGRLGSARLDVALRLGAATPRFNAVDRYVGAVIAASGLGSRLPEDAIGLGIAHASTSRAWRAAVALGGDVAHGSETAFELTWRHALSERFALLPHLHFVRHPGAAQGTRDAWVFGLRVETGGERRFITAARQPAPAEAQAVARNVSQD